MLFKRKLFYLLSVSLIIFLFYEINTIKQSLISPRPIKYRHILQNFSEKSNLTPPQSDLKGNIPEIYFVEKSRKPRNFNKTCAKFPQLFDLKFNNDLWQVQHTTNWTFYLFNAYLDRREQNNALVRIVGLYTQLALQKLFYCQFWFHNVDKPSIVQSHVVMWIFHHGWNADRNGLYHPYIITCPLNGTEIPMSVSLVEKPCDNSSNNLKIIHRKFKKKKNFVVCVKGLNFPNEDKSVRLIEWIELLNILGADKINFYQFAVDFYTKKVLDYYESLGMVEVTPINLAGDFTNEPSIRNIYLHKKPVERRLQEVIPYNDCLYKHLEEFKFILLLDTDEIIVPVNGTWVELIQKVREISGDKAFYFARNVYFFDNYQHNHDWFEDIPTYMHMLQHVYRAKNYTKPGHFVKGFHDVKRVQTLHNHFPIRCYNGCAYSEINITLAHLQHYRPDCVQGVGDCEDMKENSVLDTRSWNYKNELIERVERTLKNLDFLNR